MLYSFFASLKLSVFYVNKPEEIYDWVAIGEWGSVYKGNQLSFEGQCRFQVDITV